MPCYRVPYTDRNGVHETTKWAGDKDAAKELVKKMMSGHGLVPTIGQPVEVVPHPFTDGARLSVR